MTASTKRKPSHIYLFVGQDSFSTAEKVRVWTSRFAEKYNSAAISVFDCEEMVGVCHPGGGRYCHPGQSSDLIRGSGADKKFVPDPISLLKNALSGRTLFSATSLLIVKNIFSKKAAAVQEMLCRLLPSLSGDTFCVLIDEKRDPKSELSKLLTALCKKGVCAIEEFIVPADAALKNWIAARARQYGGSFDPRALSRFLAAYQQEEALSLWSIDSEVRKLVSYSGKRPITIDDVCACACLPTPAHVFDLSDALIAGDAQSAYRYAHALLGFSRSAFREPLLRLTAFLMTQFRSFLIVKNMEEDGQPESEIARVLAWNPKRVWVVKKKLSRHSTISLREATMRILDLERALKTGSADPLLSLDLLIKKTPWQAQ